MLPVKWNRLSTLLAVAISFCCLGVSGCPSGAPEFNWHPKVYIGDSRTKSVVRKDDAGNLEQIMCSDKGFDHLVAMDNTEIAKAKQAYFDVINECVQWKSSASRAKAVRALDLTIEIQQLIRDHITE